MHSFHDSSLTFHGTRANYDSVQARGTRQRTDEAAGPRRRSGPGEPQSGRSIRHSACSPGPMLSTILGASFPTSPSPHCLWYEQDMYTWIALLCRPAPTAEHGLVPVSVIVGPSPSLRCTGADTPDTHLMLSAGPTLRHREPVAGGGLLAGDLATLRALRRKRGIYRGILGKKSVCFINPRSSLL